MIRFAVVGTNWITHAFCQAAHKTRQLQLCAVYSRKMATAQTFASDYFSEGGQATVVCYDDLQAMADNPDIDAFYIASPNSLHASQAALFLQHGKHVIAEKPLASNIQEIENLINLAEANRVVLFEAMKTSYMPNLQVCREALPRLGRLRKIHFSYCQHSSRYQKYLDGENPNTFNPAFSNGSLMDIGIYPLTAAIELFGKPERVTAKGVLLDSGVDAHGSLILDYDGFDVLISHSKVSDGLTPSEIQGEAGTLLIEHISECRKVTLVKRGQPQQDLTYPQFENTMQYEAEAFATLVRTKQVNHRGLDTSRTVSQIITDARKTIGVVYPADH